MSNSAGSVTSSAAVLTIISVPTITTQPVTQTVNQGVNVTLSVVATTGGGTLAYQWSKGGVVIAGATSASYTLTAVTSASAGSYTVAVSNAAGSVTSSAAVLTVITPPTITTQPATQTANQGANVTLSVVATTGGGTLAYQWSKGGVAIAGATSASLTLTGVTSADAASYTVAVSNSAGSVTSSAAVLTIISVPTITTQPVTQTVNQGANVTLSVVATTGGGTLTYQWSKDGVAIGGATSASYAVTGVTSANAGSYTVVASNAAGSVTSSAAVLTVISVPTITTQPATQSVITGGNVTFSVVATTGGGTLAYQWSKGGVAIAGATSASYTITGATSGSAGTYTVTVSNAAGSVTSSGAVLTITSVVTAPTITTQPATQTANQGASVTLSVVANNGGGTLTYQWSKGGVAIGGATSSSYTLASVTSADAASYTVVVSNSAGSVTSSAAVLTVISVPTITTQPATQTITVGANVTFSVVATTGGGTLTYQWSKGGVAIGGATSSSYTITSAVLGSAGTYTVTVSNSAGSVTSSGAVLTVNAGVTAPTITTQPATQTVNPAANVTFSVVATTGGGTLAYQWSKDGVALGGATSSSYTITGVTAGNAGTYTVAVSNSAGSVTSSGAVLTVNAAPTLTTQPRGTIAASGANVSFTVAATGTAPFTYQWRLNGANIGGATSATLSLTGVTTNDSGLYSVVVGNVVGNTTSGNAILAVRPPPVPPTIVTNPPGVTVKYVGDNIDLTVAATGTAPLFYQWQVRGTNIPGATTATLSLTALTLGDAGAYTAVVTNSVGSATSHAAWLLVRVPTPVPLGDSAAPAANKAPVAVADLVGATTLGTQFSQYLVLTPGHLQTVAVLDASRSSDPDHDTLRYTWQSDTGNGVFQTFATTVSTTNTLDVGSYTLQLLVNDPTHQSSARLALTVITAHDFGTQLLQDIDALGLGAAAAASLHTPAAEALTTLDAGDWAGSTASLDSLLASLDTLHTQGGVTDSQHAQLTEQARRLQGAVQSALTP